MEVALTIISGLAVLGLIALGVVQSILAHKEREVLHKIIKSKDLSEYVAVTSEEPEEEEEEVTEVSIDEIPFLGEETRE